ncbi:Threonyl-tRNA synthetase [Planoprotostelium fungivorum]|uniref:threonine--tRNA ligase n=1 Tax=Planoprotostelium fungivorum TaxID=1890364 RepID=A0A2P6NBW0_9EUKA|nr:Threonyl-tRNA synthetase [Planoprotostelium fungivorum]
MNLTIGKSQELFMLDKHSPGNVFFLPNGTKVFNRLLSFLREQYVKRGYDEVITPNVFNTELWKTSGHLENYSDDMFRVTGASHKVDEGDQHEYLLKPMNCPSHCLIFRHKARSYKELPLRMADFGVLHRNELSGALTGLTRLRKFHQDDAHIFCRRDQIKEEIKDCLDFISFVYGKFGFQFRLELSTRPEKFIGEISVWDKAEAELKEALDGSGLGWKLNEGDGAFYGPKIDIHISDAMNRSHQCATVQLDFNLPERFQLEYANEDNVLERPVMIHRAILGSVERMMAILIEHTGGKWPFWLSPRQAIVIPVSATYGQYAEETAEKMRKAGFHVTCDLTDKTMQKKVREAQVSHYNYVLVVGERELKEGTVAVRDREGRNQGTMPLDRLIAALRLSVDTQEEPQLSTPKA